MANNTAIFARATEIANERYPTGANATLLAEVLREAIQELRLLKRRQGD